MDIVLEFADALFFDRAYAYLWPALPGPSSLAALSRMGARPNATATWSHIHGLGRRAEAYVGLNNYRFRPASQLISMPPTRWAYETGWQRDDPWRQLLSLYLITW
jgi:Delta7-sterol 5-desaturase